MLALNVYALNSLSQHPHNWWWATSLDLSCFSTTWVSEWHSITMATVMHWREGPIDSDDMWSQTFSAADAALGMDNSRELLSGQSRRWNITLNHLFRQFKMWLCWDLLTCLKHEAQNIQRGKSANLHAAFTAFSNLLFVLAVVYVYVCIYTCALAKRGWDDLLDGIRLSWFSSLLLQLRASPITTHPNLILPLLTKSFGLWGLKFLS